MEFKHLNQPDFDREREGSIEEILANKFWWKEDTTLIFQTRPLRRY